MSNVTKQLIIIVLTVVCTSVSAAVITSYVNESRVSSLESRQDKVETKIDEDSKVTIQTEQSLKNIDRRLFDIQQRLIHLEQLFMQRVKIKRLNHDTDV